jgi:hypothetical protein
VSEEPPKNVTTVECSKITHNDNKVGAKSLDDGVCECLFLHSSAVTHLLNIFLSPGDEGC